MLTPLWPQRLLALPFLVLGAWASSHRIWSSDWE